MEVQALKAGATNAYMNLVSQNLLRKKNKMVSLETRSVQHSLQTWTLSIYKLMTERKKCSEKNI